MLTARQLRDRAAAVPPYGWVVVLAFGGLGVLIWHQWANTKHPEDSWLDPEQPAGILDSTPEVAPTRARQRSYPGSVSSWGCSKVGDC